MKIPLIRPFLPEGTREMVCSVLDSGMLSEGPVTREFEEAVGRYIGCGYAIATTSCTVGLEIALRAVGVSAGDEVVVPDFTYPASALAVENVGAVPVIVDVDARSMLVDYSALEAGITEKTRAIMPVSLFGNPLDYARLDAIREKHGVRIVEDAACALGAEHDGKKVGTFADITVFSTHPRKVVTTGEGGIITTNHENLAEWMRSFKRFGIGPGESGKANLNQFVRQGTNGKLSDILSAVGLCQIRMADEILARRRALARAYVDLLAKVPGVEFPRILPDSLHSHQSFIVFIENRDAVRQALRAKGIEVQIGTYALHHQKAFRSRCHGKALPGSDFAYGHSLALPLFHQMTAEEQQTVVRELARCIESQ